LKWQKLIICARLSEMETWTYSALRSANLRVTVRP